MNDTNHPVWTLVRLMTVLPLTVDFLMMIRVIADDLHDPVPRTLRESPEGAFIVNRTDLPRFPVPGVRGAD